MILTEAVILTGLKALDTWGQVLLSPQGQRCIEQALSDAEKFKASIAALYDAFPPFPQVRK
jgi:hypothetical protein